MSQGQLGSFIVRSYVGPNGRVPFEIWIKGFKDKNVKARILSRIDRLGVGNFGDCKSLGGGLYELRIHTGPGYRVYFTRIGAAVVLLLGGGDKSSQFSDIQRCKGIMREIAYGKEK